MRASQIAHRHRLAAKLVDGIKALWHDEFQPAVDLRRTEKSNFFASGRLGVKIFNVFDDDIAGVIEQRGFEFLLRLDVYDVYVHGIMALGHRLDAVDDRRAVVVALAARGENGFA